MSGDPLANVRRDPHPPIVCLCGSTRFGDTFAKAALEETLAGRIVLSVGCYVSSDADLGISAETKVMLDELHLRKIDMADEVLILNVDGYIGKSTWSELCYALGHAKRVRFLDREAGVASLQKLLGEVEGVVSKAPEPARVWTEGPACTATAPLSGSRCELAAGHVGEHARGTVSWGGGQPEPKVAEAPAKCGAAYNPNGDEFDISPCVLAPGHEGEHEDVEGEPWSKDYEGSS